jgi:undecaprenyl-diphosphatase
MMLLATESNLSVMKAVVLGAVQGLSEFLPISSSAHLVLVPWLLGWQDPGLTFDVALHIGTFVAVLLYFWRDVWRMAAAVGRGVLAGRPFAAPDASLAALVVLGSIPGAVVGFIGDDPIDAFFHRPDAARPALAIIAIALILLGLLMAVAERSAKHLRPLSDVTLRDALIVGAAQTLALVPGVSRSGSTITAGLFLNLRRETAARFSFLLALPITAGAALKKSLDVALKTGLAPGDRLPFAVGILTAGLVGYACIAFLLRYLQRGSTLVFTIYRVVVGVLVLVLLFVR